MYFQNIISNVFEPTALKITVSLAVAISFLIGDAYTVGVLSLLMLVIFDTILGTMSAWHEGQAITSRRFSRVVQKCIVYFMAVSAGYFCDITIQTQAIQAVMIGFIGVTEFISVLENVGRLGYQTPKKLLNQLKNFQSLK